MEIIVVAAMDSNSGIGFNGGLPWPPCKEDMRAFRRLTLDSWVLMGRKTYDSIGKPLDRRFSLVVTQSIPAGRSDNVIFFSSFKKAVDEASSHTSLLYVIGGRSMYDFALQSPLTTKLILTRHPGSYPADVYFPTFSDQFRLYLSTESHSLITEQWIRKEHGGLP